jgi:hypothetical protein
MSLMTVEVGNLSGKPVKGGLFTGTGSAMDAYDEQVKIMDEQAAVAQEAMKNVSPEGDEFTDEQIASLIGTDIPGGEEWAVSVPGAAMPAPVAAATSSKLSPTEAALAELDAPKSIAQRKAEGIPVAAVTPVAPVVQVKQSIEDNMMGGASLQAIKNIGKVMMQVDDQRLMDAFLIKNYGSSDASAFPKAIMDIFSKKTSVLSDAQAANLYNRVALSTIKMPITKEMLSEITKDCKIV